MYACDIVCQVRHVFNKVEQVPLELPRLSGKSGLRPERKHIITGFLSFCLFVFLFFLGGLLSPAMWLRFKKKGMQA